MNAQLLEQAQRLSLQDQLQLVTALWDGIAKRNAAPGPTHAQKTELDWRLADHEANPDDVISWSEVKATALAHIGQ